MSRQGRQESLTQEDKNNDIDNNKSKSNTTTTKLLGTKNEANDKIRRLCWWKERQQWKSKGIIANQVSSTGRDEWNIVCPFESPHHKP